MVTDIGVIGERKLDTCNFGNMNQKFSEELELYRNHIRVDQARQSLEQSKRYGKCPPEWPLAVMCSIMAILYFFA